MGCWLETCAVTHTVISENQPVFMIIRKKDLPDYHKNWWVRYSSFIFRSIKFTAYGTYNDYGWINEVNITDWEKENDYERPDLESIFVHKGVMDKIISIYPNVLPPTIQCESKVFGYPIPDNIDHVYSLVRFAHDCRLDLNVGLNYKGTQSKPENFNILLDLMRQHYE